MKRLIVIFASLTIGLAVQAGPSKDGYRPADRGGYSGEKDFASSGRYDRGRDFDRGRDHHARHHVHGPSCGCGHYAPPVRVGHWEYRTERYWVPERYEQIWVPAVYTTVCINRHAQIQVLLTPGHYVDKCIPGYWETRQVRVWVNY